MIVDKANIVPVLEHYGAVVPTRSGWAKMKCPFHNDSHASAAVHLEDNVFKCHGCQYKGDAYAIIMQKEGVEFREAITIAEGILNSRGEVLPQRTARGRGLSNRAGNNFRRGDQGSLGRRLRTANGS